MARVTARLVKKSATESASADVCPKCGGPKRGRGYTHVPGCELATGQGARPRASKSGGFSIGGLRSLSVSELLKVREQIDEIVASKAPEVEAEISRLQDTLKMIKKL